MFDHRLIGGDQFSKKKETLQKRQRKEIQSKKIKKREEFCLKLQRKHVNKSKWHQTSRTHHFPIFHSLSLSSLFTQQNHTLQNQFFHHPHHRRLVIFILFLLHL
ncbi:hypothetical protein VIGAN_08035400 [Vigna angularis var. angularis]|uniref:Uncharacterized protein n=1 Tax=Vigna angularis var. angularis TaxID=157739 RepID=A0A0S3SLX4_PHAAN|nr:hypothetical protein VIGAN_08035400 [Vigna angularis var. angularis]